jgi:hypothetical protein
MKSIHTLRGVVQAAEKKIVFDNDLRNVGWKIKEFYYWPNNMDSNPYVWGKLWIGNDDGGSLGFSDAQDNRAIAWAQSSGTTPEALSTSIVDPDHIITGQLRVINGAGDNAAYLIVLEKMDLSTDQEIMALIKERSQDAI